MSKALDLSLLSHVLPHYNCSLENATAAPLGNGLINDTYLVKYQSKKFVLQRINEHVFMQPELIIKNAELIHKHLLNQKALDKYPLELIGHINSIHHSNLVHLEQGYWRAIQFIPNCYSIEIVETPEQALQAATAFAQFTSALSDFPASELAEIIPNFHNLEFRLEQLQQVIIADPIERLSQCQSLVDEILSQKEFIHQVATMVKKLPIQVTHNDTKINNLLFSSKTNSPIAVIDLDTCMPGFVMHDFGDMVRTCCSNLAEDGTSLENMALRLDIFSALSSGYVATFGEKLSDIEKESLVVGALLMPFMVAIRFLTDYIDGDNYFHIDHPQHNLQRAKNQLNLFKLLSSAEDKLTKIIQTS